MVEKTANGHVYTEFELAGMRGCEKLHKQGVLTDEEIIEQRAWFAAGCPPYDTSEPDGGASRAQSAGEWNIR